MIKHTGMTKREKLYRIQQEEKQDEKIDVSSLIKSLYPCKSKRDKMLGINKYY